MPTTYAGSSTGRTPRESISVTNPVDADALTAASNNSAIQTLANFVQFLAERAGLINYTNVGVGTSVTGWVAQGASTVGAGILGLGYGAVDTVTKALQGVIGKGGVNGVGVHGVGDGTGAGGYFTGG